MRVTNAAVGLLACLLLVLPSEGSVYFHKSYPDPADDLNGFDVETDVVMPVAMRRRSSGLSSRRRASSTSSRRSDAEVFGLDLDLEPTEDAELLRERRRSGHVSIRSTGSVGMSVTDLRASGHGRLTCQEQGAAKIRPFAPPVNGTWESHFIQRTLTINEKPFGWKDVKNFVKVQKLPKRRHPNKPTTFTFNSWTPLATQKYAAFAVQVPSLPYTVDGDGAQEVGKVQKLCGLKKKRHSSTHYITVCTVKLTELPQAFIDPKSGLPTIKMKASSVVTQITADVTIEFLYDSSEEAYGAFMAHALMLEGLYKSRQVADKKGKSSNVTVVEHIPLLRSPTTEADTNSPNPPKSPATSASSSATTRHPSAGSSPSIPRHSTADDANSRARTSTSSPRPSTTEDVTPEAAQSAASSTPTSPRRSATGSAATSPRQSAADDNSVFSLHLFDSSPTTPKRSSAASISSTLNAIEDADPGTPLLNYTRLPPLNLQVVGYDFFARQGVSVNWMADVYVAPRACIPYTSYNGEEMMFTPIYAGFGGEAMNARMSMYMVQYGATERECRALVEVLTLTPIFYSDYVDGENEQTEIVKEDKMLVTELTKIVLSKTMGRPRREAILIPRVVPYSPYQPPTNNVDVHVAVGVKRRACVHQPFPAVLRDEVGDGRTRRGRLLFSGGMLLSWTLYAGCLLFVYSTGPLEVHATEPIETSTVLHRHVEIPKNDIDISFQEWETAKSFPHQVKLKMPTTAAVTGQEESIRKLQELCGKGGGDQGGKPRSDVQLCEVTIKSPPKCHQSDDGGWVITMDSAVTGKKKRRGQWRRSERSSDREFVSHFVDLWNAYHLKKGKNKKKMPIPKEYEEVLRRAGYNQKTKHIDLSNSGLTVEFNDRGSAASVRGKKLGVLWYQPDDKILACKDDKGEVVQVSNVVMERGACKREEEAGLFSSRSSIVFDQTTSDFGSCRDAIETISSFVHFEDDIIEGVGDLFNLDSDLHKRGGATSPAREAPKKFKAHISIGAKAKVNRGFAARKATPKRGVQKDAKIDYKKGTITTDLFPHRPSADFYWHPVKVTYGKKAALEQEVKLEVEGADTASLNQLRRALGVPLAVEEEATFGVASHNGHSAGANIEVAPADAVRAVAPARTKATYDKDAKKALGDEKKDQKYFLKTDLATPSKIDSDGYIQTDVVLREGKMRPRVVVASEPARWQVTDHSATGPVRIWKDKKKFKEFIVTLQFPHTPRSIFEGIFKGHDLAAISKQGASPVITERTEREIEDDDDGAIDRQPPVPLDTVEQRRIDDDDDDALMTNEGGDESLTSERGDMNDDEDDEEEEEGEMTGDGQIDPLEDDNSTDATGEDDDEFEEEQESDISEGKANMSNSSVVDDDFNDDDSDESLTGMFGDNAGSVDSEGNLVFSFDE
ncbi:hypothetical protein FOZ60_004806 [Perkinsus olseni]|uniref:Transmembrane protein n=1 Tax=Perkinsus olseni TaxID=32597 RepID=A0A7J6NSF8_PEROL|nr:hypothetical protein FOZ60_004806 [Perkinsus olseni]